MGVLPDYLKVNNYFYQFNFESSPLLTPDDVHKIKQFKSEDIFKTIGQINQETFIFKDAKKLGYKTVDKIVKNYIKDPVMSIKIDDEIHKVVIDTAIERFLCSYNLNHIIQLSIDNIDWEKFNNEIIKKIESFYDLNDYQNSLNKAGGDGYNSIFEKEILDIQESIFMTFYKIRMKLDKSLIEDYFFYDSSKVEDLSVIDGIRCFKWSGMETTRLNEYFSHIVFVNCSPIVQNFLYKSNEEYFNKYKQYCDKYENIEKLK